MRDVAQRTLGKLRAEDDERPEDIPQIFGGEQPEEEADRREDGPMSEEEIQSIVREELDDSIAYIDQDVAPDRAKALRYYRGDGFGNEEEGRSKLVNRMVREVVLQILPPIVEIFAGSEQVVQFAPRKPGDEELAEQRTDYVNYIFREDCNGFMTLYEALHDALLLRSGVIKWWWDTRIEVRTETYEGMTALQVQALASDPDVADIAIEQTGEVTLPPEEMGDEDALGMMDPPMEGMAPGAAPPAQPETGVTLPIYKVTVRREREIAKPCAMAVPGEEFLYSRRARTLAESPIVAHRSLKTFSDLVALGIDPDWLEENSGSDGELHFFLNPELEEREPDLDEAITGLNKSMGRTLYTESWLPLDRDGDGIAELTLVKTVGWNHTIIPDGIEDADEIPFALGCPLPTPHKLVGEGTYDDVGDLQYVTSMVLRSTMDSLAQAIVPRMAVVTNQVTMADVLNNEVAGVIRTTQQGAVTPLVTPFVGREGLSMLEWFEQMKQSRTGTVAPPDPDALQSTTKQAVTMQERAATQRVKFIARVLAENLVKPLFKGLQRMLMRHQDVERMVRLRGSFVEVNPKTWESEFDVVVTVGLGEGTHEQRVEVLEGVAARMEGLLEKLGLSNPLVSLGQYRHVLAKILELNGYPDASQFYKKLPLNYEPPPQEPKPTPEEIVAQIEMQKIQAEQQREAAKLAFEREKMAVEDARERFKIEMDMNTRIAIAQIAAEKDANLAEHEANAARIAAAVEEAVARSEHATRRDIAAMEQEGNLAGRVVDAAMATEPKPEGVA